MADDLLGESGTNRLAMTRHGPMLFNRHDSVVGRSLDWYGEYFEQEAALFRQCLRAGDVVVDVGANIGAHTIPMAQRVGSGGRVLAFEPIRLHFQTLCANVALNSIGWVDCIHGALGARDETLHLLDVPMEREENYGGLELAAIPGDQAVPVFRLDGCFRQNRLRLIKIDVEGMEADVLDGARAVIARFRPALYVENDRVEKSRELILLLQELGYACHWVLTSFHNPSNFFGRREALYEPGFVDDGERLRVSGMGVNLFCVPREADGRIAGLPEVLDPAEHPLLREWNPRFTGGGR